MAYIFRWSGENDGKPDAGKIKLQLGFSDFKYEHAVHLASPNSPIKITVLLTVADPDTVSECIEYDSDIQWVGLKPENGEYPVPYKFKILDLLPSIFSAYASGWSAEPTGCFRNLFFGTVSSHIFISELKSIMEDWIDSNNRSNYTDFQTPRVYNFEAGSASMSSLDRFGTEIKLKVYGGDRADAVYNPIITTKVRLSLLEILNAVSRLARKENLAFNMQKPRVIFPIIGIIKNELSTRLGGEVCVFTSGLIIEFFGFGLWREGVVDIVRDVMTNSGVTLQTSSSLLPDIHHKSVNVNVKLNIDQ